MEVTSQCRGSDITEGRANKSPDRSQCITSQPTANGTLPRHAVEAPPPRSDRAEDRDSGDDSLTDSSSTNDVSRLLPPRPAPTPPPPTHTATCNRHSSSLPHHHRHHHHQSTNQKRLSSSKSHASLKTDAAHIKEVAGDDCCAHCLLACLFCELWSMCSVLGDCLVCGGGGAGCCDAVGCCCCCAEAGGVACTEEACQAVLDCGILEDCCGSSDCLEICLECCSICFPT
ncbi:myoD family inhibitor domain-containing protein-like [Centroberyx affinis]|uniref:myoD family inhibitor domain-containing protein-like n=1 Tax=Centroberyx affinis TaxID=166261 RepID=UPI003A5BA51C